MPAQTNCYQDIGDVVSPDELIKERPDLFNKGRIDWWLRNRDRNGLSENQAVIQVGRRLFFRRSKFTDWFMSQNA